MSIRLHPTKGVNPRLTFCRRCGGEANELILVGAQDMKYTCDDCGTLHYGRPDLGRCGKCKGTRFTQAGRLTEYEKLPASDYCDDCKKEIAEHKAIVEAGGIYWQCPKGHGGAIRHTSPLAARVREKAGIAAPKPVGIKLEEDNCPACHPELVKE